MLFPRVFRSALDRPPSNKIIPLIVFGYDQLAWDGEDAWSSLSSEEQAAATRLGYNEYSWNYDIPQTVDDLCWDALTPEQEADASVLGFDRNSWDDDGACE